MDYPVVLPNIVYSYLSYIPEISIAHLKKTKTSVLVDMLTCGVSIKPVPSGSSLSFSLGSMLTDSSGGSCPRGSLLSQLSSGAESAVV